MKIFTTRLLLMFVIFLLSVGLFLAILYAGDDTLRFELKKEAGKTLLQLILIGLIGIYAKYLLDQHAAERAARKNLWKSQIDALNTLTTNYWQIKKAFHIIKAHRSAKSYGEQIRQIIDFRLKLQKLNNEILVGMYKFENKNRISECLTEMDIQLEKVIEEWKDQHIRLSQLQKKDEMLEEPKDKKVPNEIDRLKELNAIGKNGFEAIHGPFEDALSKMRYQLKENPDVVL